MLIYTKILLELHKESSLVAQHNNMMKMFYQTEDSVLKEYLHNYCKGLSEANRCNKQKLYQKASDIISNNIPNKVVLMQYCEQMVNSKKPEWQILAERNGWKPPIN